MTRQPAQSVAGSKTVERYGAGAVGFHWTMFLLVVVVGILGLLHDSWLSKSSRRTAEPVECGSPICCLTNLPRKIAGMIEQGLSVMKRTMEGSIG